MHFDDYASCLASQLELAAIGYQRTDNHHDAANGFDKAAEYYGMLNSTIKVQEMCERAALEYEAYAKVKIIEGDYAVAADGFERAAMCYEKLSNITKAQEIWTKEISEYELTAEEFLAKRRHYWAAYELENSINCYTRLSNTVKAQEMKIKAHNALSMH